MGIEEREITLEEIENLFKKYDAFSQYESTINDFRIIYPDVDIYLIKLKSSKIVMEMLMYKILYE